MKPKLKTVIKKAVSVEPQVEKAVTTNFEHKVKAVFTKILRSVSHDCETNFHFHAAGKHLHDASSQKATIKFSK